MSIFSEYTEFSWAQTFMTFKLTILEGFFLSQFLAIFYKTRTALTAKVKKKIYRTNIFRKGYLNFNILFHSKSSYSLWSCHCLPFKYACWVDKNTMDTDQQQDKKEHSQCHQIWCASQVVLRRWCKTLRKHSCQHLHIAYVSLFLSSVFLLSSSRIDTIYAHRPLGADRTGVTVLNSCPFSPFWTFISSMWKWVFKNICNKIMFG